MEDKRQVIISGCPDMELVSTYIHLFTLSKSGVRDR
jgi:hypothetical protein